MSEGLFGVFVGVVVTLCATTIGNEMEKESRLWDCSRSGGQYVSGKGCMVVLAGFIGRLADAD